jgi:TetR/AcrR family transcriptional regulator, lmrAB and yxaGH operons repressor
VGRRTDTRDRIVRASLRAMRERGYSATAISDIVDASGAPRGSVTFHFRGGKDEIAREVIALRTSQVLESLERAAADTTSAAELLATSIDQVAAEFAESDFLVGCPVVPIAIERARTRRSSCGPAPTSSVPGAKGWPTVSPLTASTPPAPPGSPR